MICRLCVGVLTWHGLVISWSFSISVKMPAKKEEDDENNYSQCVHLSTAQQDGDTSQLSVLPGKKSLDTRSCIDVKLFSPTESCQN